MPGICRGRATVHDYDCDGTPNGEDDDIDADGVGEADNADRFPFDPTEFSDNDLDGIGDNADLDDDNDGLPDELECQPEEMLALLREQTSFGALDFDNGPCDGNPDPGVVSPLVTAGDLINDVNGCFGGVSLNSRRCTFTNPRFPDSDLDGLSDGAEWAALKQFLGCAVSEEIFDAGCPLDVVTITYPDTSGPMLPPLALKQTYPPLDPNTDADRPDGVPITAKDDPAALDGFDPSPYIVGTALDVDSDNDGLSDSDERFYGTNPFRADSDGDGMLDRAEVARDIEDLPTECGANYCSTPNPVFEIATFDIVVQPEINLVHRICRYNPCDPLQLCGQCTGSGVFVGGALMAPLPMGTPSLNPNVADVDGDGIPDGTESAGFSLRNGVVVHTNPVLADTDGDEEAPNPNCSDPDTVGGDLCDGIGDEGTPISFNDRIDNCPTHGNSDQRDSDFDGAGDVLTDLTFPGGVRTSTFGGAAGCDLNVTIRQLSGMDYDGDGIDDNREVQPQAGQIIQTNPGDADTDNDGINDGTDNCPLTVNSFQALFENFSVATVQNSTLYSIQVRSTDLSGPSVTTQTVSYMSDADATKPEILCGLETQLTLAGIPGVLHNTIPLDCPNLVSLPGEPRVKLTEQNSTFELEILSQTANLSRTSGTGQLNQDEDKYGAACDSDDLDRSGGHQIFLNTNDPDFDGLMDYEENFGLRLGGFRTSTTRADSDGDGIIDSVDNCPCASNPAQEDDDLDGIGDVCESSFGVSCQ
ncbi:MAG: thrombospondin type 3 repeat-containing protein, partial [Chrysiogenetes bacterium]|nr:thrombospondin type 3 repeat-containing protein [Chrysiogenetes bacterium]